MILVPMDPDTTTDEEVFSTRFHKRRNGLFEELGIAEGFIDCAVDDVEESFALNPFSE